METRAAYPREYGDHEAAAEIDSLRAQLERVTRDAENYRHAMCSANDRLVQALEQGEKLRSSALDLQYYVNNPSAWDQYDDAMSERIRPVVEAARALTPAG